MKSLPFFFCLFFLLVTGLSAQEDERFLQVNLAWQPGYHEGYNGASFQLPSFYRIQRPSEFIPAGEDEGRQLGNPWGVFKIQGVYTQRRTYPLFQSDHWLLEDSQLEVQIDTFVSPVTLALENRLTLIPVPFMKLQVGAHMGTGWTLGITGLGLHSDGSGDTDQDSFAGMVLKSWFQGTLQMDTAVFWPGDWHHIVFSSSHKLVYQFYSAAGKGDAWQYMLDKGENFNGWVYEGSHVIAYQMPQKFYLAGIMLETSQNRGYIKDLSPYKEGGWGSDFTFITAGPLAGLKINDKNTLLFLLQLKNERLYTRESLFYNYFQNRSSTGESYWYFDRLAMVYRYTL